MPSEIGVPMPDEEETAMFPAMETVRLSVGLSLYVPGESDTGMDDEVIRRQAKTHAVWPTENYHRTVQDRYYGRAVLFFREQVKMLCREAADMMNVGELLDGEDTMEDLIFRYSARWWMAPRSLDVKGRYHPSSDQTPIHQLAAVDFIGHLYVWS